MCASFDQLLLQRTEYSFMGSRINRPCAQKKRIATVIALAFALALTQGCSKSKKSADDLPSAPAAAAVRMIDAQTLAGADLDKANWMIYGRTYNEQRFSPLDQINKSNVDKLHPAWFMDLGPDARGQQGTPLVVDGTMYVTTSWSRVIAVDAATGVVKWHYDPKVPGEWGVNACCDVINRGAAFWQGRLYIGTLDGRLIAFDAATGKQLWETVVIDRAERASITGAPRVIKGRVYVGSAGGEFGVRGRLIAVDADTGAVLWRFFTVPGDSSQPPENLHLPVAMKTWSGKWWEHGGGGTVWDAMSYDPVLDLLYIGTGNGSPWPQSMRSPKGGDNLYVSSIMALRAETGEVAWHYQTTPGDEWGFDAASQLILADLPVGGRVQQVIMQAAANGFFYVLDRREGRLISATPFVPTTWAEKIDPGSGRPVEARGARYSKTGKPFLTRPSPKGAHSWQPMSFDPTIGLVYIPAQINAAELSVSKDPVPSRYRLTTGTKVTKPEVIGPDSTELIAWDPLQQRGVWAVERKTPVASGVLATAGGVLLQGSTNGKLEAFDSKNGERLWQTEVGSSVTAPPITYAVNGKQYLAVLAGSGGASILEGGAAMREQVAEKNVARLIVYSLDGKVQLPSASNAAPSPSLPEAVGTQVQIKRGAELYASYCARCHGQEAVNAGPLLSLTESTRLGDPNQWKLVVFAGLLGSRGMPGFLAEIKAEDTEAVRAYVISRARDISH